MTEETKNDNLLAAVAYLGWFVTGLILLLAAKPSKFVRFHAMQSIIASVIILIGFLIVPIILAIIPFLGVVLGILWAVVFPLVVFVLWIVLMWKAFQGETYKLPYVGAMAEKQLAKMA